MKTESEFEVERANLLADLTLFEDHGYGKAAKCPYCMEKHASKIAGYAFEIAAGQEGDQALLTELGDTAQAWQKRCDALKQTHDDKEFLALGVEARDWRRKIQGAHGHSHAVKCVGANCELKMSEHDHHTHADLPPEHSHEIPVEEKS